jgi:hypothetical protein
MLTTSEIYKEYARAIQDPIYAIETYLETFDKTQEGFVPFKLFPRQKQIVNAYEKHRYNLVTKPRQAGISTTTQAYMAIKAAFADSSNPEVILVIANKLKLSMKFLKGIKDYLKQIPRWVWGAEYYGSEDNEKKTIFITDSKIEIHLPNGSQIIAVATSEDALRGYTPTYLVFDEAAFIDNGAEVYTAAMSSISTGGKVILISTPNGMDPLYYKTYEQSKSKKNKYHIVEMRWYEDPRYNKDLRWIKKVVDGDDIMEPELEFNIASYLKRVEDGWKPTSTWYENMCMALNNNARRIAQELDVSFLGSGGNVIEDETIDLHDKKNVEDPKFVTGIEEEFWMWEEPIEGHEYIMGVDVSRGDGEDSSTIVIVDFTTMEEVFEYQGKIQPDLLAQHVYEYGNMYNAYTVVDITGGMGVSTVLKLIELNYSNKLLHYDKKTTNILPNQSRLETVKKQDKVPGFNVNGVRLPMIANLEKMLRENTIKVKSRRLVSEMKTFVYKNGRPDHMDGYHDDLLMSLGMCLWVLEYSFKNLQKANTQNKAILNSWTTGGQTTAAIKNESYEGGFVSQNNKGKKTAPRPRFNPNVSKNMQDPHGQYMWLFSGTK